MTARNRFQNLSLTFQSSGWRCLRFSVCHDGSVARRPSVVSVGHLGCRSGGGSWVTGVPKLAGWMVFVNGKIPSRNGWWLGVALWLRKAPYNIWIYGTGNAWKIWSWDEEELNLEWCTTDWWNYNPGNPSYICLCLYMFKTMLVIASNPSFPPVTVYFMSIQYIYIYIHTCT